MDISSAKGISASEAHGDFSEVLTYPHARPWYLPWIDRVGIFMAGLCAAHCFVFMLGSLVLGFTAPKLFLYPNLQWLMILLLATFSLTSQITQHHYGKKSALMMAGGLSAICLANFLGIYTLTGELLCQAGGLILALGHVRQLTGEKSHDHPENVATKRGPLGTIAIILLAVICVTALF